MAVLTAFSCSDSKSKGKKEEPADSDQTADDSVVDDENDADVTGDILTEDDSATDSMPDEANDEANDEEADSTPEAEADSISDSEPDAMPDSDTPAELCGGNPKPDPSCAFGAGEFKYTCISDKWETDNLCCWGTSGGCFTQFGWVNSNWDDTINAITISKNGNLLIAGSSQVNNGDSTASNDIFFGEYKDQNPLWTKQYGTKTPDTPYGIDTDSLGNIYITGATRGNLDGQTFVGGEYDAFVSKYSSVGELIWTRILGSTGRDEGNSVAVGSDGSVFVAGIFTGAFEGIAGSGNTDMFIKKLDADGNKLWTTFVGSDDLDFSNISNTPRIKVDKSGSIWFVGTTLGYIYGTNQGRRDAVLLKTDKDGVISCINQFGTAETDVANDILVNEDGTVFVTGSTEGDLFGEPNQGEECLLPPCQDIFLTKFDNSCQEVWTKQFGTAHNESGLSMSFTNDGKIAIAGFTNGLFESFLSNSTDPQDYDKRLDDVYLAILKTDGSLEYIQQWGTNQYDYFNDLVVLPDGTIYAAGTTNGNFTDKKIGGKDALFMKFKP